MTMSLTLTVNDDNNYEEIVIIIIALKIMKEWDKELDSMT